MYSKVLKIHQILLDIRKYCPDPFLIIQDIVFH